MAKQTFETALKTIEDIVRELEDGALPLEESMKKFEQGMKLIRFCSEKLDETEQKITVLMTDAGGEVRETPFEASDE